MSGAPGFVTGGEADLLETIVAATRRSVAVRRQIVPLDELARQAAEARPRGQFFHDVLARPDCVNVIAECKRRSPSRGVIRAAYDPVAIAREYEAGGAAAISVLTEPTFFDGSLDHLAAVRQAVELPLLRKDFIVDPYQIVEAAAAGADALLLIVAALDDGALRALLERTRQSGVAALVEVHDEAELARALAAGADIVGVNNRNLRTLQTDTGVSARLAAAIPENVVAVAESGLRTPADIVALRGMGYDAFLVGESLMAQPSPGDGLARLIGSKG
jgi:indole-3-glycerol phosphate synthase